MNCQRFKNCPRCGNTMIFRKFYDYGGHSWAWECVFCKVVIDPFPEVHRSPQKDQIDKDRWGIGKSS